MSSSAVPDGTIHFYCLFPALASRRAGLPSVAPSALLCEVDSESEGLEGAIVSSAALDSYLFVCSCPRDKRQQDPYLFPPRSFHAARWVGALPGNVCRWSVIGAHFLSQQSQANTQLCPMMRGVQEPSPEDPYALATDIKKWDLLQPPCLLPSREPFKARTA